MSKFELLFPRTVNEALEYLQRWPEQSRILAGGTDLLVKIKSGKANFPYLIRLKKISELHTGIKMTEEGIFIGPAVTMAEVCRSREIQLHFPALRQAAYLMGSQQIRNRATVVGNICNASPAAETAAPLLVYEASVCLTGSGGAREISIGKFFKGPGETHRADGEIVTGIRLPLPAWHKKSMYRRLSRRLGVDLSIINLCLAADGGGKMKAAYGSLAPVPFRAPEVEKFAEPYLNRAITGKEFASVVAGCLSPIDDIRSSKEYKIEMAKLLTAEMVDELAGKKN